MTMNKIKKLNVSTTQGNSGELTRESQYVFNYRTDQREREISLTMPLTATSYTANILPGVIRQNLPEGFLLQWMKDHFGKIMKMDDFNVIALTGGDAIGRVRCSQADGEGSSPAAGESLQSLLAWKGTEDLFDYLSSKYAATSGISGVQPKVILPASTSIENEVAEKSAIRDASLIVKAAGQDWEGLAENEYHCMTIAKKAGLIVPPFWLSDDRKLFIAQRFDRDADGGYLGFEDMTALTGVQNDDKYAGSYEKAAKVVDVFASSAYRRESLIELYRSIVLSVAVRNGDAHLKNFGMLYTTPQSNDVALSPLYDIVNTTCYLPRDVLALSMAKTKGWPDRATLMAFGKTHCGVQDPGLVIDRIIETASRYRPDIEAGPIWEKVKKEIDRGCDALRSERLYVLPPARFEPS